MSESLKVAAPESNSRSLCVLLVDDEPAVRLSEPDKLMPPQYLQGVFRTLGLTDRHRNMALMNELKMTVRGIGGCVRENEKEGKVDPKARALNEDLLKRLELLIFEFEKGMYG